LIPSAAEGGAQTFFDDGMVEGHDPTQSFF
jgi:hypothetical protein